MEGYQALKKLPIFEDLTLDEMRAFYLITDQVEYKAGDIIIEQGRPGEGLIICREGSLSVSKLGPEGDEVTLATLPAGSYVGEMALIDDAPTSARVTANEDVKAIRIQKQRFEQFLFSNDRVAIRIYRTFIKTLSQRLRQQNTALSARASPSRPDSLALPADGGPAPAATVPATKDTSSSTVQKTEETAPEAPEAAAAAEPPAASSG